MRKYFSATMQVLQTFVKHVQNSTIGEVTIPLRISLLFYRDRHGKNDCRLEYVTKWAQELTHDVDKVIQALDHAKFTLCNSQNVNEAVWEATDGRVRPQT
jgi:hypothetical protein